MLCIWELFSYLMLYMKSVYFKTAYFLLDANFLFNLRDISQIAKHSLGKKQFVKRTRKEEGRK